MLSIFFQGTVMTDEGDYEGLVIGAEFAEWGDLERAVESEVAGWAG